MMKKILIMLGALVLGGWQSAVLAGDAAAMAEGCIDCHDMEEFKGMDAAALAEGIKTGAADNKMMAKNTADLSPEDIQAIAEYLAAEANK